MPSEIIDGELYTLQINQFRIQWKRLDAAMTSMEPALLTSPELFPQVPGTRLRRLKLVGFSGVPPLSIFFTIDGDQITLRSVELIDFET
jgi:hypothetical protein